MYFIIFFPPFAALIGWVVFKIFTILMKQNFYKQKGSFAKKVASAIKEQDITTNITAGLNAGTLKKWEPEVKAQIEHFLVHKLPQKMPALAMFTSDKIVQVASESATEEIMSALPGMIKQYADKELTAELIAAKVEQKLQQIEPRAWDRLIDRFIDPLFAKIQFAGAILGFVLGLAYILCMFVYAYISA